MTWLRIVSLFPYLVTFRDDLKVIPVPFQALCDRTPAWLLSFTFTAAFHFLFALAILEDLVTNGLGCVSLLAFTDSLLQLWVFSFLPVSYCLTTWTIECIRFLALWRQGFCPLLDLVLDLHTIGIQYIYVGMKHLSKNMVDMIIIAHIKY